MVTYRELEAFASVGLFHNDPTDAHSASSQIDVDCALATVVNNVRTTTAGRIVRWKTEIKVFIAPPLLWATSNESAEKSAIWFETTTNSAIPAIEDAESCGELCAKESTLVG